MKRSLIIWNGCCCIKAAKSELSNWFLWFSSYSSWFSNFLAQLRLIPFDDYVRVRAPLGVAWRASDLQFSTQGVRMPSPSKAWKKRCHCSYSNNIKQLQLAFFRPRVGDEMGMSQTWISMDFHWYPWFIRCLSMLSQYYWAQGPSWYSRITWCGEVHPFLIWPPVGPSGPQCRSSRKRMSLEQKSPVWSTKLPMSGTQNFTQIHQNVGNRAMVAPKIRRSRTGIWMFNDVCNVTIHNEP